MPTQSYGACGKCNQYLHLIDALCATCRTKFRADAKAVDSDRVLEVLSNHIGIAKGVNIKLLADECAGRPTRSEANEAKAEQRHIRNIVEELRKKGHHICAHPSHGYFIAETPEELDDTCTFLYRRAMTSLSQVAAMKRVALPDLAGQLQLRT